MLRHGLLAAGVCVLAVLCSAQLTDPSRTSIVGPWENAANPSEHLNLGQDGQFSLDQHGQHHDGTWSLSGKTLQLHLTSTSTLTAQWNGDAFIDSDQTWWIRPDAPPAPAPRQPAATRPGTREALSDPGAPPPSPNPALPQSTASVGGEPACPAAAGAYYLDGRSWRPMYRITPDGTSTHVKPIPFASSAKGMLRYRDAIAPVNVGPTPRFCLNGVAPVWRNVIIVAVDVKNNYREVQVSEVKEYSGLSSGIPPSKRQLVDLKPVSTSVINLAVMKPLLPGQYMIFPQGTGSVGYDFGVIAGLP